jgi:hypothetical protein
MKATNVQAWTEEVADGEYEHYVAICDDDGDPVRGSYTIVDNVVSAEKLALALGRQMDLEVITDDLMR